MWPRVWAANFSYFNPGYIHAYLQGHNIALEHLGLQVDAAEDNRITECLRRESLDKHDDCMSTFFKLQDHSVHGLGGENMVQLYM